MGLNLALGLTSVVVCLGIAELLARLVEEPPPRAEWEHHGDWREWQDDFFWPGERPPSWPLSDDPNRDGLRDTHHAIERSEGVKRVVCLGDSVTYGWGLQPGQAWPQRLNEQLAQSGVRVEILNVAMPGWTTRQQRIAYQRIARKYRPDEVWLGVCLNDPLELQNNLSRPPELLLALHQRSALLRLLVDARGREVRRVEELFASQPTRGVTEAFERFFAELRLLQEATRRDGVRLSLLVFPYRFQYRPDAPPAAVQGRIRSFAEANGLPQLDLLPTLATLAEAGFIDHNHLNSHGADRVAAALAEGPWLADAPSHPRVLGLPAAAGGAGRRVALDTGGLQLRLHDRNWETRAAAAWMLGRNPSAASPPGAVSALLGAGADRHELVRSLAITALGASGAGEAAVRQLLLRALTDPHETVRLAAARALWGLDRSADELPALVAGLDAEDPVIRAFSQSALAAHGPEAVRWLVKALDDAAPEVRRRTARLLGRIGPAAAAAAPALAARLGDPDPRVRINAARALGRIGPAAAEVLPSLEQFRTSADAELGAALGEAIDRIRER